MDTRTASVIASLAAMVEKQAQEIELLGEDREKDSRAITDLSYDLSNAQKGADRAEALETRCADLSRQLANAPASNGASGYDLNVKAKLFDVFLACPIPMSDAINYLNSAIGAADSIETANKIAMIKQVRETASLGLREAKDLVEAYIVWYRATGNSL